MQLVKRFEEFSCNVSLLVDYCRLSINQLYAFCLCLILCVCLSVRLSVSICRSGSCMLLVVFCLLARSQMVNEDEPVALTHCW